jgi:hypothetical protein
MKGMLSSVSADHFAPSGPCTFRNICAIAKPGTALWKAYNKFDDLGDCASTFTKLVHGGCFVAGTHVTVSELPFSASRESTLWSETDWISNNEYTFSPSPLYSGEKGPGDEGVGSEKFEV